MTRPTKFTLMRANRRERNRIRTLVEARTEVLAAGWDEPGCPMEAAAREERRSLAEVRQELMSPRLAPRLPRRWLRWPFSNGST
jgi:hypothetical protein